MNSEHKKAAAALLAQQRGREALSLLLDSAPLDEQGMALLAGTYLLLGEQVKAKRFLEMALTPAWRAPAERMLARLKAQEAPTKNGPDNRPIHEHAPQVSLLDLGKGHDPIMLIKAHENGLLHRNKPRSRLD